MPRASASRRRPARSSDLPAVAKASPPMPPRRCGCRGSDAMLDDDIVKAAEELLAICKRKNLLVGTAESCTAGLIAGTLTEIPGASSVLDRGFVTYSDDSKHEMLGVAHDILQRHGAVSRETAEAMARGVL